MDLLFFVCVCVSLLLFKQNLMHLNKLKKFCLINNILNAPPRKKKRYTTVCLELTYAFWVHSSWCWLRRTFWQYTFVRNNNNKKWRITKPLFYKQNTYGTRDMKKINLILYFSFNVLKYLKSPKCKWVVFRYNDIFLNKEEDSISV